MSVIEDPQRQQLLEDAYAQGAAPGEPANWELHLGDRRLLLLPATGEWLHWDVAHENWEPTGYRVAEVTFRVVDGHLGVKRTDP